VSWTLRPPAAAGGEARLALRWQESGGPVLDAAPRRRGFGSRLLERGLALELRGTVRLDFAPPGLVCTIEAPLAVVAPGDAAAGIASAIDQCRIASAASQR
jgi:two-component sensor histidine kinase